MKVVWIVTLAGALVAASASADEYRDSFMANCLQMQRSAPENNRVTEAVLARCPTCSASSGLLAICARARPPHAIPRVQVSAKSCESPVLWRSFRPNGMRLQSAAFVTATQVKLLHRFAPPKSPPASPARVRRHPFLPRRNPRTPKQLWTVGELGRASNCCRPTFGLPEVPVAVCTSLGLAGRPEKREYSWQIGSHPGNPG